MIQKKAFQYKLVHSQRCWSKILSSNISRADPGRGYQKKIPGGPGKNPGGVPKIRKKIPGAPGKNPEGGYPKSEKNPGGVPGGGLKVMDDPHKSIIYHLRGRNQLGKK